MRRYFLAHRLSSYGASRYDIHVSAIAMQTAFRQKSSCTADWTHDPRLIHCELLLATSHQLHLLLIVNGNCTAVAHGTVHSHHYIDYRLRISLSRSEREATNLLSGSKTISYHPVSTVALIAGRQARARSCLTPHVLLFIYFTQVASERLDATAALEPAPLHNTACMTPDTWLTESH